MRRPPCVTVVLVAVGWALASTPVPAQQAPSFRTVVTSVRVHVQVTDRGRPVEGLTRDDFIVTDNGRVQAVDTVAAVDGLSTVVLIDATESVSGEPLALLTGAAQVWVDALHAADWRSVVVFADGIRVLASGDATSGRAHFEAAARSILGTRSAVWDAVFTAASLLRGTTARPVLAVFTDACDNASWLEARAAAERLSTTPVTVDLIVTEPSRSGFARDPCYGSLDAAIIPKATGGRLFGVGQRDLHAALARRIADLRQGYLLSFTPTGVPTGDGWHPISVRLKNKRGQVQARAGYYSSG